MIGIVWLERVQLIVVCEARLRSRAVVWNSPYLATSGHLHVTELSDILCVDEGQIQPAFHNVIKRENNKSIYSRDKIGMSSDYPSPLGISKGCRVINRVLIN